jgi:hypothetical protein
MCFDCPRQTLPFKGVWNEDQFSAPSYGLELYVHVLFLVGFLVFDRDSVIMSSPNLYTTNYTDVDRCLAVD